MTDYPHDSDLLTPTDLPADPRRRRAAEQIDACLDRLAILRSTKCETRYDDEREAVKQWATLLDSIQAGGLTCTAALDALDAYAQYALQFPEGLPPCARTIDFEELAAIVAEVRHRRASGTW